MELLICFAMLLVFLFHIDFISFNFPHNQLNIDIQPIQAYLKKWQFLIHILITDDYWFVPAYLSLYIFSPVINSFIEKANKHTFATVVIAMLLIQSVYGWISPNEAGYLEGRSPFSFFLLLFSYSDYEKTTTGYWMLDKLMYSACAIV